MIHRQKKLSYFLIFFPIEFKLFQLLPIFGILLKKNTTGGLETVISVHDST
jgi:hypothetical protein